MGFCDIHHHLIYGVDDGPETAEEMRAMVRMADRNDVTTIVATAHYMPGVRRFEREKYEARLSEARAYCAEAGFGIEILPGAEVLYDPTITRQYLDEDLPTLGGTNCVLAEFMPEIGYADLTGAVGGLSALGYTPVLAHIERYECLMGRLSRAYALKERYAVLYQVNAGSVLGERGLRVRMNLKRLLEDEMIDAVATDAHNVRSRPCNLRKAHQVLAERYGASYADELTGRDGKSVLFEHM